MRYDFLFSPWFLLSSGLVVLAVLSKIIARRRLTRDDRAVNFTRGYTWATRELDAGRAHPGEVLAMLDGMDPIGFDHGAREAVIDWERRQGATHD